VVLGFAVLRLLPDRPEQAAWLSPLEKQALADTLAAEAEVTREVGYAGLVEALTRPRILMLGLLYFLIVIGLYGLGFWLPQVIETFGHTPLEIGFLAAIPYLFASVVMVLWGRHSDATGERTLHIALPLLFGGLAFAWSAVSGPLIPTMVALTLAAIGIYAAIGTFWSFPTAILAGTGAAAGLALVNSLGNLGGLAGPWIVGLLKQATGSFAGALFFLAGSLILGACIAALFGYKSGLALTPNPPSHAKDRNER
jgi:MFS transporter, ACS family, tartrate transporter